jgi:hypothetical protein
MIDGTKNSVFTHHSRKANLDLLHQMLPLLGGDPATTAWFGELDQFTDTQEPLGNEEDMEEKEMLEIVAERRCGRGSRFQVRYEGDKEGCGTWIAGRELCGTSVLDAWLARSHDEDV